MPTEEVRLLSCMVRPAILVYLQYVLGNVSNPNCQTMATCNCGWYWVIKLERRQKKKKRLRTKLPIRPRQYVAVKPVNPPTSVEQGKTAISGICILHLYFFILYFLFIYLFIFCRADCHVFVPQSFVVGKTRGSYMHVVCYSLTSETPISTHGEMLSSAALTGISTFDMAKLNQNVFKFLLNISDIRCDASVQSFRRQGFPLSPNCHPSRRLRNPWQQKVMSVLVTDSPCHPDIRSAGSNYKDE